MSVVDMLNAALDLDIEHMADGEDRAKAIRQIRQAMVFAKDHLEANLELIRDLHAALRHKRMTPPAYVHGGDRKDWRQIGLMCSSGRRSLWFRWDQKEGEEPCAVEICGGREGDDFHLKVERGQPLFEEILDMCFVANFAAET